MIVMADRSFRDQSHVQIGKFTSSDLEIEAGNCTAVHTLYGKWFLHLRCEDAGEDLQILTL